jgi:hypothetical protein
VREIQKQLDFYDPEILAEWEALAGVVESDDLDQRELDRCRRANAAAIRRADIEARIAELGEPSDRYQVLLNWGGKLGVDYLRKLAIIGAQLVQATLPMKAAGELKTSGDPEECLKWVSSSKR